MPITAEETRIGDFLVNKEGVSYVNPVNDQMVLICSPLVIVNKTKNAEGTDWGKLCLLTDPEGNEKCHHFYTSSLTSSANAIISELVRKGLTVSGHARSRVLLTQYLRSSNPAGTLLSSHKQGWVNNSFLLPDDSFGPETVVYSGSVQREEFHDTIDWKRNVGQYCSGNSRLVLAASTAFAAPLLKIVEMEGGGFYIRGESSEGKSTALYVASSVCGHRTDHFLNFDTTKNALEEVAEVHNDCLLILDELGRADSKTLGGAIYMLTSGRGKSRKGKPTAHFRVLTLSSGELPLAEKMAQGGTITMNGQEIRFLDISSNAGVGMGIFEQLHSFDGPKSFAEYLDSATRNHCGKPLREFLEIVTSQRSQIQTFCASIIDSFTASVTPKQSNGQIARAIRRFGLVAAAGEIATQHGITGWKRGESIEAATKCFNSWLEHRKTFDPVAMRVERVKKFILKHDDQFQEIGGEPVEFPVGYRKGTNFLILPDPFRDVVCAGAHADQVAQALEQAGYLNTSGPNRLQKQERILGEQAWVFSIKGSILEAA